MCTFAKYGGCCAMHREHLACIEWQKSQTGENRLCRVCVCLFVCSSELKSNEFQLHRISCMAIQDERENSIVSLRNTEKHTHTLNNKMSKASK